MTGILMLESLTRGNTLKQGDKTPLTYRLLDADGDNLNIAGKQATVRLVYPNYLTIGYEKSGLLVSQDDTVTFTIDNIIPSRKYNVEIIVDNKFVFPSRSAESKFTIDRSTLGTEANIIEIVGVDAVVRKVLGQVQGAIDDVVSDISQEEANRVQAEQQRQAGYEEVKQIIEDGAIDAVPSDGSIGVEKLSFARKGTNLYNPDEAEIDMYLHNGDGKTYPADNFIVSGYIDISESDSFFIKSARRVVYYDKSKVMIGSYPTTVGKNSQTYTEHPQGTFYIRFDFGRNDFLNIDSIQQVNLGSQELPYEPYREPIISKEYVERHEFEIDDIPDKSITKEKVNFISLGKNLFDASTGKNGFISWATGEYGEASSLRYFAPIPVIAGEKYVFNTNARMIAFFNGTNFVSGINMPPANTPIIAPPNSNNIIITLSTADIDGYQFEKGEKPTSYEPYGYRLNGITLINEEDKTEVFINLPEKVFSLVGEELNIYFDNILSDKDSNYTFDVTCSIGKQYTNYYRVTPTTAGDYSFIIKVLKDGDIISQANTTIVVADTIKGAGLTKSLLVIGDSTTAGNTVVNKVAENFESDSMNITLVGTKGSGVNKHEGISGWTARQYTTLAQDQTLPDVKNPFFNSETNKFDFSYYSTTTGVNPDYVVLNLGINDLFSYTEDGGAESRIVEFISQYHEMIDSMKLHHSSIKIGVALTIPPAYSQDAFAESYSNGQTRDRAKRNNVLLVRRLIEEFDNTDVDIVPINTNLDTRYNFPMDYVTPKVPVNARNIEVLVDKYAANAGVHPAESGYWQIADVYWYWIKSIV